MIIIIFDQNSYERRLSNGRCFAISLRLQATNCDYENKIYETVMPFTETYQDNIHQENLMTLTIICDGMN